MHFAIGKPAPEFESVSACLEVLPSLLLHDDQYDTVCSPFRPFWNCPNSPHVYYIKFTTRAFCRDTKIDAAWALSYLTDGSDEKIQAVINT